MAETDGVSCPPFQVQDPALHRRARLRAADAALRAGPQRADRPWRLPSNSAVFRGEGGGKAESACG